VRVRRLWQNRGVDSQHHRLPDEVSDAMEAWLELHDRLAPGMIEGLYVIGSVSLGDMQVNSDVDIVAVTREPADEAAVAGFKLAAAEMAQRFDRHIDGPYLCWLDLALRPTAAVRAWVLDGEFRFDDGCFEMNPVGWYTLATNGIAVRGKPAAELDLSVDASERIGWVRDNVQSYWSGLVAEFAEHVDLSEKKMFDSVMFEWTVLGIARMWFTIETGDVASKSAAGKWAADRLPEHSSALERAVELRSRPGQVPRQALLDANAAMAAMLGQIADIPGDACSAIQSERVVGPANCGVA
jgi:predicted nucleotidyltransferase